MSCRIAICDDRDEDAAFAQHILEHWAAARQTVVYTEHFPSAESFLFRYEEDKAWDILLLDIEMGTMDGITLARRLRAENDSVQIIFITGYADFMSEGYDVSALHYLIKPVREDKLFAVLDRASVRKAAPVLLLPVDGEMLRLPLSEIHYIEAFSHKVSIVTRETTFQSKQTISEMAQQLDDSFLRCHRSYLVNLRHIARLSKTEIVLDSGQKLPLSRSAAPHVHKAFVSYYAGERDETI